MAPTHSVRINYLIVVNQKHPLKDKPHLHIHTTASYNKMAIVPVVILADIIVNRVGLSNRK